MYTNEMKKAVHSLDKPKNFGVNIYDNDTFLVIKLNEKDFINMVHDEKIQAVQYVAKVKNVLEQCGAIVLVTREAIK